MSVYLGLDNKVAVVTGGATGIGRGISLLLAENGADVVVCDMNFQGAQAVAGEISAIGRKSLAIQMNVTSEEEAKQMVETVDKEFGRLDILYNNAGTISMHLIEDLEMKDWESIFAVNVTGVFVCSKAVIPYMRKQGGGRIINTASQAGKTGLTLLTHYCATKAAVIGFTRGLALEVAKDNILVNCFCPGSVMTDMTRREAKWASEISKKPEEEILAEWESAIPLGHYASPAEVARLATFLASDYAGYMTGQAVNISGGQEMH